MDRHRSKKQSFGQAHMNGPESDCAGEDPLLVPRHQTKAFDRRHTIAQTIGGQRLPTRRKAQIIERLDLPTVIGLFRFQFDHATHASAKSPLKGWKSP
jgi:hypothetical protein